MAIINYVKEWQRIAQRLDWAVVRLRMQMEMVQTDEERAAINARLESVYQQIDRARNEADRLSAKRLKVD